VASAIPGAPDTKLDRGRFLAHTANHEYAQAYALIERSPDVVGNTANDLLLAADAARFSGHPAEATKFLERIAREHAHDSVAPLAAFTLGRIYLSQLGQPAKAASSFALARKLAPSGPLVEDALAREVEASSAAGERERAQGLAREYERRFPNGRRLDSVRQAAGLVGDSSANH
jgi:transmembrane sensor